MALKYTTVKELWEFLGINESILSVISNGTVGATPEREIVAETPVTTGVYYLDQPSVNTDTLALYVGSSDTVLILDTDYTFDASLSKITITSDGATKLTGEDLTAVYEFSNDMNLTYEQSVSLLERMEQRLEDDLGVVFADQTANNPAYKTFTDQLTTGKGWTRNLYRFKWRPIVKLETTVDTDYTTGGSTLTLTDATGFPNSATIYVGGNKVSYTAKTGNDLTVPTDTPSISANAVVRGEVVEVSTSPQGTAPAYTVLTPDVEYAIDYNTGTLQLMGTFSTADELIYYSRPVNGTFDRVRYSYVHAWHDIDEDCVIPTEIEELVYMMAGRQLIQRTVVKANVGQRDNFTTDSYGFSKKDIEEIKQKYRMMKSSNI